MRIGIDIDDTITNSYNKILEELQKEYGINRFDYINQGKTYYDIEQQKSRFPGYDKFCSDNFERILKDVPLKHGVVEILNKLRENGHDIFFITARHLGEYKNPYEFTKKFLDDHQINYNELHTGIMNKGKFCQENNIDLFIDDTVKHCKSAKDHNIKAFLFDNTFNRETDEYDRVYSWYDVYERLEQN